MRNEKVPVFLIVVINYDDSGIASFLKVTKSFVLEVNNQQDAFGVWDVSTKKYTLSRRCKNGRIRPVCPRNQTMIPASREQLKVMESIIKRIIHKDITRSG